MNNFKELNVWQKAFELVKEVYQISKNFPNKEQFGLISQIRRAAVSIPPNIADGAGKMRKKEFAHFLSISLGSSYELETQLIISLELKFTNTDTFKNTEQLITEVQRMIRGLQKSLK